MKHRLENRKIKRKNLKQKILKHFGETKITFVPKFKIKPK